MKYISKITLGLILCTGLITSCKDDDDSGISGAIAVDKEEISIAAEGGTEKIAVSTNSNWVASSSKPWIAISPANGAGSAECSLAIDSTLENTARTAQIRFSAEGQEPKLITITQFGFGKQILLKEPEVEIESSEVYEKRYLESVLSTNINFKIDGVEYSFAEEMTEAEKQEVEAEREGWITLPQESDLSVNLDRKARPRTLKVRFNWDMNIVPYTRVAKIRLVPVNPTEDKLVDSDGNETEAVVLTIKQKAALRITDDRAGDSLTVITINAKVQSMVTFDTSENMQNWDYVTLWEATDKDLPATEAVGRVRSVSYVMIDMKDGESLPKEIRHLKYLESFSIQSNVNRQLRTISLGEEICELKYLKYLSVSSYGMKDFPENFIKLGGKVDSSYRGLETLNIASNNFTSMSSITDVLNEGNFPKLYSLSLNGCRTTDTLHDLSLASGGKYNGKDIGLNVNLTSNQKEKDAFLKLFTWESLRQLVLAYNFLEGTLPTDTEMEAALTAAGKPVHYQEGDFFTKEDLKATPSIYLTKVSKDTCDWLTTSNNEVIYGTQSPVNGKQIPRVLPNARVLFLNLNFLTGSVPNWILFHPYFAEWHPETLVFNQQEGGKNSAAQTVGFDNVDLVNFNYGYYYGNTDPGTNTTVQGVAYPLYYRRFVANASTAE